MEKEKLFVAFRPNENIKDEISITSGHAYKNSTVSAKSGKSNFSFFSQGEFAWLLDENEEKKFYSDLKNDEWINALEPIGTGPNKEHLSRAPWLIIIFAERYGMKDDGTRYKILFIASQIS